MGTKTTENPPANQSLGLLEVAFSNALAEHKLNAKNVDGVFMCGPHGLHAYHKLIAAPLGIGTFFGTTVYNSGASQTLSVIVAVMAIEAGRINLNFGRWKRSPCQIDDR